VKGLAKRRTHLSQQEDPERTVRPPHIGGVEHQNIEDRAIGDLDAAIHVHFAEIQFRVEQEESRRGLVVEAQP
jgi:hypothetical protein